MAIHTLAVPEGCFIELNRVLKFFSLVPSGGHAKMCIQDGQVLVNHEVEYRIRRKLYAGDTVQIGSDQVNILPEE